MIALTDNREREGGEIIRVANDDDDLPAIYLVYAILFLVAIGGVAIGLFAIIFRS